MQRLFIAVYCVGAAKHAGWRGKRGKYYRCALCQYFY